LWLNTRIIFVSPTHAILSIEGTEWYEGAVPVDRAASEEAMTHHALGKQKKEDCQDGYKQHPSDSEPG